MRNQAIIGFEWDKENIDHIAKHGVIPSDVEEAFLYDIRKKVFLSDKQYGQYKIYIALALIKTKNRLLKIVYFEKDNKIVIKTAFFVNFKSKEGKLYKKL